MILGIVCAALITAASLFYIFYLPGELYLGPEKTRASYLRERKDVVYENLRDLNFEYRAGKVPDADYQSLKANLQDEAAGASGRNRAIGIQRHSRAKKSEIMNHSPCPIILSGATASRRRALAQPKAFRRAHSAPLLAVLLLAAAASAQTLTGVVKNATTGKPGAGDEVILITLGNGMEEAGRTKADSKGNFSFKLEQQGPHLVRVIHQEVTYHRMAPPGTTSVEVEVNDVGKSIEGIEVVADIMRFQAQQGQLQIERTFAVQNNSKPPRTQMNEHNLEFYVPEGATINEGQAMTAGGQPVKSAPVPEGEKSKNKYSFLFPLRPGETRFNVVYTVPYTGSMNIDPKSVYPLQHFVAIAPKSMNFEPAQGAGYQPDELSRAARCQRRGRLQCRTRSAPGIQALG